MQEIYKSTKRTMEMDKFGQLYYVGDKTPADYLNDVWQSRAGSKIKEQRMNILTTNDNKKLLLCK